MKKLLSLFNKKKKTDTPDMQYSVTKPIGITSEEYTAIRDRLCEAFYEADLRRKKGSTKPSGCMRGIAKAIEILDSIQPHTMEVQ